VGTAGAKDIDRADLVRAPEHLPQCLVEFGFEEPSSGAMVAKHDSSAIVAASAPPLAPPARLRVLHIVDARKREGDEAQRYACPGDIQRPLGHQPTWACPTWRA